MVDTDPVVLEKKIFKKFCQCILAISYYLPLEKGGALHLNKIESPFTQDCFVPSMVDIGPVVLEE